MNHPHARKLRLVSDSSCGSLPPLTLRHYSHLVVVNSSEELSLRKSAFSHRSHYLGKRQQCVMFDYEVGMSRLIWTPLKLVPPGTNFSEIFGPTLKNLFPLQASHTKENQ